MKKANPERQEKSKARYAKQLAAYRKSETFRIVKARAGGRCERRGNPNFPDFRPDGRCIAVQSDGIPMHHHHKTYARFGGSELPTDIELLCEWHHNEAEALKPAGNRFRRSTRGRAER